MHEAELKVGNYKFGRLKGVTAVMEFGPDLSSLYVYRGERGVLARDGSPVALAEVPAENRQWPALGQIDAQHWLRDLLAPGCDLHEFISGTIRDLEIRKARIAKMEKHSLPFSFPDFVEVPVDECISKTISPS